MTGEGDAPDDRALLARIRAAGGRCTATYGDVKCWRERGHTLQHHGVGDTWWSTGEVPPSPFDVETQDIMMRVEASARPGMALAAVVLRSADRRVCGPAWLERLAIWLLERAGYVVCR